VIRSEELECFILGFGLEIPDEGLGRPVALTPLWVEAKEKCGDCNVDEVLDALYNLNPNHAELHKFVPLDGKYQAVSFERKRHTPKWKDFFYGDSFRIKVLPPGRVRFQRLCAEMKADKEDKEDDDSRFARLAIEEARKSLPEDDRPHPKVGAVVVKDGRVVSKAHRGESPKSHAEFIALEGKLVDDLVAGSTVYTTLEPCTTRNHPKIPCAQRLVERKVARVVMGMLDPNPDIRGRGDQLLSDAGIETQLFPRELRAQVEEMNREFIRSQRDRLASAKKPTADEDQSSWPDVILECQWPSLVHESKIPGSHIVRKRPWMLRHGGPGAVYNVCVHEIDFGEYEARFPFPVRTLTDTASVYPIICWKSDGLVINAHDLESLIHNPPSGCDVGQYALEIDGSEDEGIRLEDFVLEVEIPVTISYDDKNGNQFKIKYLLHYDTYMEKGEMARAGRIEKVAPK
jgi:pyrimidine deaminase RibD-like protein